MFCTVVSQVSDDEDTARSCEVFSNA